MFLLPFLMLRICLRTQRKFAQSEQTVSVANTQSIINNLLLPFPEVTIAPNNTETQPAAAWTSGCCYCCCPCGKKH